MDCCLETPGNHICAYEDMLEPVKKKGANDMNKIFLLGRLTSDPVVRVTSTEKTTCSFRLAVDRPVRKGEEKEADFINVVLWNKTAEIAGNSLAKGHRVLVEGRLQIRSYQGKDGQTKWITEVIGDRIEFIEKRGTQGTPTGNDDPMSAFGTQVPFDENIPF